MKTAKYFTATWCGPCKAFKPVMNEVAGEGHSIQFVDVDQNKALAQQYNVRSVPTTVIEENGVEVDRFIGALPKQSVIQRLKIAKKNLEGPSLNDLEKKLDSKPNDIDLICEISDKYFATNEHKRAF